MGDDSMTGSRIRARRLDLGLKQAELARRLEISPAYLNLIEHNRRPVAGRLLGAIARHLDTDVGILAQGAETALLEGLRDALALEPGAEGEMVRSDEFAARFPDWARMVVGQARRIAGLERAVETLNDRLTHDPFLSASLHDVLSTVTAIRATSAILADDGDVDPDWQARFHRNLFEDSQRLAESAQALVSYLDAAGHADRTLAAPQEEVEAWLQSRDYHLPECEAGDDAPDPGPEPGSGATSASARILIDGFVAQYRADARCLPLAPLRDALARGVTDPGLLARRFDCDIQTVFRRLASLPEGIGGRPVGLVICDGSGTLTFRKPVEGFALPRFGAACPLWPLYLALVRPETPLRMAVETAAQNPQRFLTYALARIRHPSGFDGPPVVSAAMLILPDDSVQDARPVGTSCRICPRPRCPARREPSIVADLA